MNTARHLQVMEAQHNANLHISQQPFPYPGTIKPMPPGGVCNTGLQPVSIPTVISLQQPQHAAATGNSINCLSQDWGGKCRDLGSLGLPMHIEDIETPSIHLFITRSYATQEAPNKDN